MVIQFSNIFFLCTFFLLFKTTIQHKSLSIYRDIKPTFSTNYITTELVIQHNCLMYAKMYRQLQFLFQTYNVPYYGADFV